MNRWDREFADLESRDPLVFEAAFACLSERAAEFVPRIVAGVERSSDPYIRGIYVELLGYTKDPSVIEILERELEHEDQNVRQWAVSSLERIGGPAAADLVHRYRARRAAEDEVESMEDETLRRRVEQYTAEKLGIPVDKLRPEARLNLDLGLWGDEAELFLVAFADEFDVDFSGIRFGDHFGSEGTPIHVVLGGLGLVVGCIAAFVYRVWLGAIACVVALALVVLWSRHAQSKVKPFTFDHLLAAATHRRWVETP